MREKVLIPNRGIIALDIIHSLNSLGLETVLMVSPEDAFSLPVLLADRSYKFYSSRLEDSYLDAEAVVEKAMEIKAEHIHPGYGFLAESPLLASMCRDQGIHFIGPTPEVLETVADKLALRQIAVGLDIRVLPASNLIRSSLDFDTKLDRRFPQVLKPLKGLGGAGIRFIRNREEASERVNLMLTEVRTQEEGIFFEEFWPHAQHIEIPFIRDTVGNILFMPEIESSIQRRFQKLLQESPSLHVDDELRDSLYRDAERLIAKIGYVGLGYIEFFLHNGKAHFSEINPTFQINTLIPEVHLTQNFLKKQFAISRGEPLHHVNGVRIIKPKHHAMLVSLMAEDPFTQFRPSSGIVRDFFHYSTIRNIFKTTLYTGSRVSQLYDPFIGKILTFAFERKNTLRDMRSFLDNIIIRGIRTNLVFLKHLLESDALHRGDTMIDFLNLHFDFSQCKRSEEENLIAAALLAADFHVDNRQKNYKSRLGKMKQPRLLRRLLRGL